MKKSLDKNQGFLGRGSGGGVVGDDCGIGRRR